MCPTYASNTKPLAGFSSIRPLPLPRGVQELPGEQGVKGELIADLSQPPQISLESVFGNLFSRIWQRGQVPGPGVNRSSTVTIGSRYGQRDVPAHAFPGAGSMPQMMPGGRSPSFPQSDPGGWAGGHKPNTPQSGHLIIGQNPGQPRPSDPRHVAYARASPTFAGGQDLAPATYATTPHLQGIATDWTEHLRIPIVAGYTFRGVKVDPEHVANDGGFKSYSMRNDDAYIQGAVYNQFQSYLKRRFNMDMPIGAGEFLAMVKSDLASRTGVAKELFYLYSAWRAIAKTEELHIGRMVAEPAIKGYISTSKSIRIAKAFSIFRDSVKPGWVYCVRVSGFEIPPQFTHVWTSFFDEAEIAVPLVIPWQDVIAARRVLADGRFDPACGIVIRDDFLQSGSSAINRIIHAFSGLEPTQAAAQVAPQVAGVGVVGRPGFGSIPL